MLRRTLLGTCAAVVTLGLGLAAAEAAYRDQDRWTAMSICNSASAGRFSTDRTMREYNEDIWRLEPIELSTD